MLLLLSKYIIVNIQFYRLHGHLLILTHTILSYYSYKSFARSSDNIGDITAKGEAQIAVIDLLGMTTGKTDSVFNEIFEYYTILLNFT